jgi:hypothetical protein
MRTAVHGNDNIGHPEVSDGGMNEILKAFDILWCLNNERHRVTPLTNQKDLIIKTSFTFRAGSNRTINLKLSPTIWEFTDVAEHYVLYYNMGRERIKE